MTYVTGTLVAEGKTKRVVDLGDGTAFFEAKDDITAGDGAKHDIMTGKARWATTTTVNVFRLLAACGVPVAFREQVNETTFRGDLCQMIPLEVVMRREAHGSYLKRAPQLGKGHMFPKLLFELFLKTSGKKWRTEDLPCDDPFVVERVSQLALFLPNKPLWEQEPFMVLLQPSEITGYDRRQEIEQITRQVFLILEKAWQMLGIRLVDFKIEFGLTADGRLVVADVIDNDSWRIVAANGRYMDKQNYRDRGLEGVAELYQEVATLTSSFSLPRRQRIVIWTGSPKDDVSALEKAIGDHGSAVEVLRVTSSAHKQTGSAYQQMHQLVQEVPDCVVIAEIGRSNGAGPTLAANLTVPVISRPATWKEVREDVWSSLHVPSQDPNLTVLDPGNAVLAAMQILARNNPAIYATLRLKQEERLVNLVQI